jgi:hypothetical protein
VADVTAEVLEQPGLGRGRDQPREQTRQLERVHDMVDRDAIDHVARHVGRDRGRRILHDREPAPRLDRLIPAVPQSWYPDRTTPITREP